MYRATTPEDAAQSIVSIGVPYASRTARVLDRDGPKILAAVALVGGEKLLNGLAGIGVIVQDLRQR